MFTALLYVCVWKFGMMHASFVEPMQAPEHVLLRYSFRANAIKTLTPAQPTGAVALKIRY